MKYINLTQGKRTVVDDDDFEKYGDLKWQALKVRGCFYVKRTESGGPGRHKDIYLHRMVMGNPAGMDVDHISHDTLDNRKENLRSCTHAQNLRNRKGPNSNNKSGIRGVCWFRRDGTWHAQIKVDGRRIHLGYFATKEEAGAVYASANAKYFGEYGGGL